MTTAMAGLESTAAFWWLILTAVVVVVASVGIFVFWRLCHIHDRQPYYCSVAVVVVALAGVLVATGHEQQTRQTTQAWNDLVEQGFRVTEVNTPGLAKDFADASEPVGQRDLENLDDASADNDTVSNDATAVVIDRDTGCAARFGLWAFGESGAKKWRLVPGTGYGISGNCPSGVADLDDQFGLVKAA